MNSIPSTASYERVQSLVVHLKQAEGYLYSDPNMSFEQLRSHISMEATDLLQAYVDQTKINITDKGGVQKALAGLIDYLQGIEKLTITTAVDLSNEFILRLHTWFEKNLRVSIAIESYVDKKILGGLLIWWRGSYIDLSLSPKVIKS